MTSRLRLTRAYSVRSLIGIALIAMVLVGFYRHVAIENLKTQETSFNISLARSLSMTLWPYYAEFVQESRYMPADALADTPQFHAMRREILDRMRGLRVVKVTIYDTGGLVVFSTDPAEIGSDGSSNPRFATAMQGTPASELLERGPFEGFEGTIEDADVLSSYIPVRRDGNGPVEAGFEIFSDVTSMVADIRRTGYTIAAGVTTLLLLLYGFLLVVVQRADRLIDRHERDRLQREQAKLDYLTRFDALTDLPNRSHFMDLLAAAVARAGREGSRLGLIYLSIDRFKLVNDSLGHEYGDRALIEFARRLRGCVGGDPVIARMGGDQFAILDPALGTARAARECAERILGTAQQPIRLDGREIVLTASLGISLAGSGMSGAEQLLENAISAMRSAKQSGRNGFAFYRHDPERRPRERLVLEMDLRKGLERGEFELHYQPRVDTRTGEVGSLEALLRWRHPKRGLIMPDEFVPLLEDMDLMIPAGAWALAEACRQAAAWDRSGLEGLRISVNVSLRQFRSRSLIASVRSALVDAGLDPGRLELELTESVLADDLDEARHILTDLKAIGVDIALDDFGTGYSSLSYLIHLPVTCLKLDRVFVTDLPDNRHHVALTTAIVAMAGSLGLRTVAEGAETLEQYRLLQSLGYEEVQGFWLGAACAADEMPALVRDIAARSLGTPRPAALRRPRRRSAQAPARRRTT